MGQKLKALLQSNMCVKRTSCFAWLVERHIKNTSQHSSDFFQMDETWLCCLVAVIRAETACYLQ